MWGCNQTASIKDLDSVFSKYIVSTSETQQHLSRVSAYSHSCVKGQVSKCVFVEVTQEASGIFSSLGSLGATFNHKDEGIQHISSPFQHIDVFRPLVNFKKYFHAS